MYFYCTKRVKTNKQSFMFMHRNTFTCRIHLSCCMSTRRGHSLYCGTFFWHWISQQSAEEKNDNDVLVINASSGCLSWTRVSDVSLDSEAEVQPIMTPTSFTDLNTYGSMTQTHHRFMIECQQHFLITLHHQSLYRHIQYRKYKIYKHVNLS